MCLAVLIDAEWELQTVLPWAWRCACALEQPLHVLTPPAREGAASLADHAGQIIQGFDAPPHFDDRDGDPEAHCHLLENTEEAGVRKKLSELSAKWLILPLHQQGNEGGAFSNQTLENLAERAPCAVMVLRPGHSPLSTSADAPRLMVPLGGGPHAEHALNLALSLADGWRGRVEAVTCTPGFAPEAEAMAERRIERATAKAGAHEATVHPNVLIHDNWQQAITELVLLDRQAEPTCDLMLFGASAQSTLKRDLFQGIPAALRQNRSLSLAVIRKPPNLAARTGDRLLIGAENILPQLNRQARVDLVERLHSGADIGFDFLALMGLSTLIAAMGLLLNSAAVVIGAMLVAPLMTPLVAAGLAVAQGNSVVIRKSSRTILLGFVLSWVLSMLLGWLALDGPSTEMLARGRPGPLDLAVAFVSGIAGAWAVARPTLSGALPGVAIAAALVPPIATSGLALSSGAPGLAAGAALLFATNVVAIILGSALALLLAGMRPRVLSNTRQRMQRHTLMGLFVVICLLLIPLGMDMGKRLQPETRADLRQAALEALPADCVLLTISQSPDGHVALQISREQPLNATEHQTLSNALGNPTHLRVHLMD